MLELGVEGLYLLNRALSRADQKTVPLIDSVILAVIFLSLAITVSIAYARRALRRKWLVLTTQMRESRDGA